jgi:hypothetical protein
MKINQDNPDLEKRIMRENIRKLIETCFKEKFHLDYEMSTFIFFLEKYSDIIFEYSEQIFCAYVKYFENIYIICNKKSSVDENNNYYFYLKNLLGKIVSTEKINDLFSILFKNKNNEINCKNIRYFAISNSGHDILQCYIKLGGVFNEIETKIFMESISENPIYDLSNSMINIINKNDVFEYTDELLEYAAYLQINEYVKRYLKKGKKITQKCVNFLLTYSNDYELCNEFINNNYILDNDTLKYAVMSKNIKIITMILNNKILPNKNSFQNIFKSNNKYIDKEYSHKLKIFKFDDENEIFLYSEIDCYNNNFDNRIPIVIRKIKKDMFSDVYEIVDLFFKYGYRYTQEDLLLAIENNYHFDKIDFKFDDDFLIKYHEMCMKTSYYPYIYNKMYPKPDKKCLYYECKKKSNIKIIKQLCKYVDPDMECLRLSTMVNNNLNVVKFFVEKKKIIPNIEYIKTHFISTTKNFNLNDFFNDNKFVEVKFNDLLFSCENSTIKYLLSKI